jgi:TonB family protein
MLPSRIVRRFVSCLLGLVLFFAVSIPRIHAQEQGITNVAGDVSEVLTESKQKSVAVFDFIGPENKFTSLGQKLTEEFIASLTKSNNFTVIAQSGLHKAIEDNNEIVENNGDAYRVAEILKVKAFIWTSLSTEDGRLAVHVNVYRTHGAKGIKGFKVLMPFTQEMTELSTKLIENDRSSVENYPEAGKGGYSVPTCIHCPSAPFTDEAANNKQQGTVVLIVVVGEDGRARDIKIVQRLPYGLTQNAIKTVKSWTFKPAIGPDGKPAAIRQTIEVIFHLY